MWQLEVSSELISEENYSKYNVEGYIMEKLNLWNGLTGFHKIWWVNKSQILIVVSEQN